MGSIYASPQMAKTNLNLYGWQMLVYNTINVIVTHENPNLDKKTVILWIIIR